MWRTPPIGLVQTVPEAERVPLQGTELTMPEFMMDQLDSTLDSSEAVAITSFVYELAAQHIVNPPPPELRLPVTDSLLLHASPRTRRVACAIMTASHDHYLWTYHHDEHGNHYILVTGRVRPLPEDHFIISGGVQEFLQQMRQYAHRAMAQVLYGSAAVRETIEREAAAHRRPIPARMREMMAMGEAAGLDESTEYSAPYRAEANAASVVMSLRHLNIDVLGAVEAVEAVEGEESIPARG